jgi:hypothetical protein
MKRVYLKGNKKNIGGLRLSYQARGVLNIKVGELPEWETPSAESSTDGDDLS